jgi:hypothetical protein
MEEKLRRSFLGGVAASPGRACQGGGLKVRRTEIKKGGFRKNGVYSISLNPLIFRDSVGRYERV